MEQALNVIRMQLVTSNICATIELMSVSFQADHHGSSPYLQLHKIINDFSLQKST